MQAGRRTLHIFAFLFEQLFLRRKIKEAFSSCIHNVCIWMPRVACWQSQSLITADCIWNPSKINPQPAVRVVDQAADVAGVSKALTFTFNFGTPPTRDAPNTAVACHICFRMYFYGILHVNIFVVAQLRFVLHTTSLCVHFCIQNNRAY